MCARSSVWTFTPHAFWANTDLDTCLFCRRTDGRIWVFTYMYIRAVTFPKETVHTYSPILSPYWRFLQILTGFTRADPILGLQKGGNGPID